MTGPSHPRTFVRRPAGLAARSRPTTAGNGRSVPPAPESPPESPPEPSEAAAPAVDGSAPAAPVRPSPRPRPAPAPAPVDEPAAATPAPPAPAAVAPAPAPPAPAPPAPTPALAPAPAPAPAPVAQRQADPAPPPTAHEPSRTRPSIPFWLLKPLLGLVLAVIALVVMIRLVTSYEGTPAPAVAPSSMSTSVTPAAPAGAQAGTVTVGGVFLLPLSTSTDSAGSLAGRTGQVVQAQGVLVLSTPSADSAWVGTSADDRFYVRLVGTSAGAVPLSPGGRVAFTGTMVPNGDGLPAGDGAALLAQQTQHVEVFPGAVSAA